MMQDMMKRMMGGGGQKPPGQGQPGPGGMDPEMMKRMMGQGGGKPPPGQGGPDPEMMKRMMGQAKPPGDAEGGGGGGRALGIRKPNVPPGFQPPQGGAPQAGKPRLPGPGNVGGKPPANQGLNEGEGLEVGNVAPEIEGKDSADKEFKLSDYRGKVVLLDFWGFW
jgi:hypothetical protein